MNDEKFLEVVRKIVDLGELLMREDDSNLSDLEEAYTKLYLEMFREFSERGVDLGDL